MDIVAIRPDLWRCLRCTVINHITNMCCVCCSKPKPRQATKKPEVIDLVTPELPVRELKKDGARSKKTVTRLQFNTLGD